MSYFAKASRTGVEKVAVAIVFFTRRRRQLSALQQGVHGRDAFACGAAFASTRQLCRPCLAGVQGRDVPSLAGAAVFAAPLDQSPAVVLSSGPNVVKRRPAGNRNYWPKPSEG